MSAHMTELQKMSVHDLFVAAWRHAIPPDPVSTAEWLRMHFRTAEGKAFNESEVPWITAPGGPGDAIDNPQYHTLWLQWSARMFKTTFAQAVMQKYADVDPCPMLFATTDEGLCKQIYGRFWKMLEQCPRTREQCPKPRFQNKTHIKLSNCEIYGAWPRGKGRLADKAIKIGHANEIDKWEHQTTSTEGDPLPRFMKHGAQFSDRKFILESTPGEKGKSRVERGRLRGTNSKYWVPCPHCSRFQVLEFCAHCSGRGCSMCGKGEYGVIWDTPDHGRPDIDLALRTARYVCRHCREAIDDIDRAWMMNHGVWVPQGCTVKDDRAMRARDLPPHDRSYLQGIPTRDSVEYSSHLSILYGLITSWGEIARDFLVKSTKEIERRQWVTEEMGDTWEAIERTATWEELGERIIRKESPRYLVPLDCSRITVAIDKQSDLSIAQYPYTVCAWDTAKRCHVIDYGYCETLEEITGVLQTEYRHADGGPALRVSLALIDSGHRPKDVGDFVIECAKRRRDRKHFPDVMMCKGSAQKLNTMFKVVKLGKGTATEGMRLCHIDSAETQDWMDSCASVMTQDDAESLSVYTATKEEHQDFLEQLLNEHTVSKGETGMVWERIDKDCPNDYRDCIRYSRVAIDIVTRRAPVPVRRTIEEHRPEPARQSGRVRRMQGRRRR